MNTPIVLNLYGEDNELIRTCTRTFVPWKMLKKAVTLNKKIGKKEAEDYDESDMDALTTYIMEVFSGQGLTVEILDEQTDVTEMMNVVKAIMNKARGVMDPTLPLKT
ncbi:MAG: hypothetical protein HY865_09625 [Chloroflexi bacterium]|nr:hypothetical protein [Chloroflexota bacterium]